MIDTLCDGVMVLSGLFHAPLLTFSGNGDFSPSTSIGHGWLFIWKCFMFVLLEKVNNFTHCGIVEGVC